MAAAGLLACEINRNVNISVRAPGMVKHVQDSHLRRPRAPS
jgi:hypothetical protein